MLSSIEQHPVLTSVSASTPTCILHSMSASTHQHVYYTEDFCA